MKVIDEENTPEETEVFKVQETPVKKHKNSNPENLEKQRANMRKAIDALKIKREQQAKEKEEKIKAGIPLDPPKKRQPKTYVPKKDLPPEMQTPRKKYEKKSNLITRDEFEEIRTLLKKEKEPVSIVEKVVEKDVPREVIVEKIVDREVPKEVIVHKEKMVSGSDLLNRIFFNM